MKTIKLTLLLWVISFTAGAQNRNVEQAIRDFLASPELTISESIVRERDLNQPGNPMKSMCEVWEFTCNTKMAGSIEHLSSLLKSNSSSEHCYYVKTHTPGSTDWHDILVGNNPKQVIELGRSKNCHYTIVNFLDTLDATMSHRYAYALEWQELDIPFKLKEQNGKLIKTPVTEKTYKGKVVITYARIPQTKQPQETEADDHATVHYFKNGELVESLKKKLKEADTTELLKSWKLLIDSALNDDEE